MSFQRITVEVVGTIISILIVALLCGCGGDGGFTPFDPPVSTKALYQANEEYGDLLNYLGDDVEFFSPKQDFKAHKKIFSYDLGKFVSIRESGYLSPDISKLPINELKDGITRRRFSFKSNTNEQFNESIDFLVGVPNLKSVFNFGQSHASEAEYSTVINLNLENCWVKEFANVEDLIKQEEERLKQEGGGESLKDKYDLVVSGIVRCKVNFDMAVLDSKGNSTDLGAGFENDLINVGIQYKKSGDSTSATQFKYEIVGSDNAIVGYLVYYLKPFYGLYILNRDPNPENYSFWLNIYEVFESTYDNFTKESRKEFVGNFYRSSPEQFDIHPSYKGKGECFECMGKFQCYGCRGYIKMDTMNCVSVTLKIEDVENKRYSHICDR
jgi:hypothetical protein